MPRNVSLTPELEDYADGKVEAGLYESFSEVVRDALRQMIARERDEADALDRLRDEIRAGRESGTPVPYDPEEIKRAGRAHPERFEPGRSA